LALGALLPITAHAVGPQPAPSPVEITFGYQKVGHLAPRAPDSALLTNAKA
jgi:hypothetical protein